MVIEEWSKMLVRVVAKCGKHSPYTYLHYFCDRSVFQVTEHSCVHGISESHVLLMLQFCSFLLGGPRILRYTLVPEVYNWVLLALASLLMS